MMAVNTGYIKKEGAITAFVNEVTADGASTHHSSKSLDNDASHLDLQPPSAICWQMAPPTRGHSEIRPAERTKVPAKTLHLFHFMLWPNT